MCHQFDFTLFYSLRAAYFLSHDNLNFERDTSAFKCWILELWALDAWDRK